MTLRTTSSYEDMTLPALTPRRNPDGTIDYAHYHRRARRMRRARLHQLSDWPIHWIRPLIAFALITAAVVLSQTNGAQPAPPRADAARSDVHWPIAR